MFGLFGKKNTDGSDKLSGPKTIPDPAGQVLVVEFKEEPEWVWSLKAVMKPQETKGLFHIRVFSDPVANKAKVSVKDYSTLDGHPEIILYEGVYDKRNNKAKLTQKYQRD